MRAGLGEAEPGIDDDLFRVNAPDEELGDACFERITHLDEDVVVAREVIHRFAVAAPVRGDVPHAGLRDDAIHLGVGEAAGDVVDDPNAGLRRRQRRRRVHGVDAHRNVALNQRSDHRHDALLLHVSVNALRAGAGRLSADVDEVCTLTAKLDGVGDSGIHVFECSTVAERIWRYVENTDDDGPGARRDGGPDSNQFATHAASHPPRCRAR